MREREHNTLDSARTVFQLMREHEYDTLDSATTGFQLMSEHEYNTLDSATTVFQLMREHEYNTLISFIFIQFIECSDISDIIHNDIRYSSMYAYYTHAVPLQSAGYCPCSFVHN